MFGSSYLSPLKFILRSPYSVHRTFIKMFFSVLHFPLWEMWVALPVGKAQQPQLQEQHYPFLSVCAVSKQWFGCQCLGVLMSTQIIIHAISHRACMDAVRESALKVDWEKNPLPHRDSNQHQYCTSAFLSDALPTELFPPQGGDSSVVRAPDS